MTQCYGDADIGMLLRALRERGDEARFYTPETRPYLQGARLTASVICDMGFDVTLITDNMPAYVLGHKNVDLFTTSADIITLDGYVVNKIGTFQIALAANYYGVPYYVAGFPDRTHPDVASVHIEERNGDEVRHAMGILTCKTGVKGYYPAFDITPAGAGDRRRDGYRRIETNRAKELSTCGITASRKSKRRQICRRLLVCL